MKKKTVDKAKVGNSNWPTHGCFKVLQYACERKSSRDFEMLRIAVTIKERVLVMEEYGAIINEDMGEVERL